MNTNQPRSFYVKLEAVRDAIPNIKRAIDGGARNGEEGENLRLMIGVGEGGEAFVGLEQSQLMYNDRYWGGKTHLVSGLVDHVHLSCISFCVPVHSTCVFRLEVTHRSIRPDA